MNLSFSGVQDNINDFILRLISSKMIKKDLVCNYLEANERCIKTDENKNQLKCESKDTKELKYVARLQPKYYFKLSKSLERSKHGIVSSIIVYKLLQYFLESDFSIDEDYRFDEEGARQFYIRREVLRAIATHTCHDIYHLDMFTFAYLLIIVDDAQDWGRRRFSDFYYGSCVDYQQTNISVEIKSEETNPIHITTIEEKVKVEKDQDQLKHTLRNHFKQSQEYRVIFKDGLDTKNRNFKLKKTAEITFSSSTGNAEFIIEFNIYHDKNADFKVKFKKNTAEMANYNKEWISSVLNTSVTVNESDEWIIWTVDTI